MRIPSLIGAGSMAIPSRSEAIALWLQNPNGTGGLYRKRSHACETTDAKW